MASATATTVAVDDLEIQPHPEVPGLFYIKDIDEDVISEFTMKQLDSRKWEPLTASPKSRLVQHYGFKYNYTTYQINEKCEPIPAFLTPYQELLYSICLSLKIIEPRHIFNQCIVNNYAEGQGISAHVDVKKYGGVIGCFTIGSGATMVFQKGDEKQEIYVEPNSLYIMSGDARFVWTHSMPTRKFDIKGGVRIERGRRISLTFRHVPVLIA